MKELPNGQLMLMLEDCEVPRLELTLNTENAVRALNPLLRPFKKIKFIITEWLIAAGIMSEITGSYSVTD